jgi:Family of unknown function (DUF6790)
MYVVTVLLLCVVLPMGSAIVDHALAAVALPWLVLFGKWFVFWSGGVRLVLAGGRQLLQPRFTAKEIFGIDSDEPLPLVQELGVANLAAGIVAALSLVFPAFRPPMAVVGLLFYGGAGIRHLRDADRNAKRNLAMATDLLVAAALAAYVLYAAAA